MEFRILGPLEIREGERLLTCAGQKQRLLLAVLLVHANEVVSSDRLIDALWGDRPPDSAGKALQVHISQLRKVLEPERARGDAGQILVTRPPGYELRVDPARVDLHRFERAVREADAAAKRGRAEEAARGLRDALALWRGSPLADLRFEDALQGEIARLDELRLAATEDRIEADLAIGRHAEVVGELEALVSEHPLRERLRAQLMLSLYRSRRQAEALEAYREARRVLVGDLGIEPGRELQELEHAVLLQDPSLDLHAATTAESEVPAGTFVGREAELDQLLAGLDAALAGRGQLFLLVGEPGIGKTRLAEEVIRHAEDRDAEVLIGRCWEAGGAPAYWPWVQSIRTHVEQTAPEVLRWEAAGAAANVAQIIPELRELVPDLPEPAREGDGARIRLFDAVARFLRNAATRRPLVLVLDDLHAGDEPSLLLLRFVARELGGCPILLVGTYRDVDPTVRDPLASTLAELAREPVTRRIELGGLSVADVERYMARAAGTDGTAELAAAIHAETEGNPLFVGEMVRLLAAEGRLAPPAAPGAGMVRIPQGVRDVIGRRLDRLSDDCRRVLTLASVLGRDFRLDALERLSELRGDELLDVLDEAVEARVLGASPGADGSLRFAHALVRDTLYDGLTSPRRVQLHRRAGEALEELYGPDVDLHLAELSHHFREAAPAGEADKAVRYARRAGDRSLELLAFEEAARLYETAIEALDVKGAADEPTRCELLLSLGDAQARGGHMVAAQATFIGAAELARGLRDPERLARAALGYGGRYVWFRAGKDERLIPLLEDALAAQPAGDSELRARLLSRLAGALRDRPVPDRRASLAGEAVDIARRLGDKPTLAYTLEGTYATLSWPRDTDAWLGMARELTQLAEETGDNERAYLGRVHAFGVFMVRGDIPAADAEFATMEALAREMRQPVHMWSCWVAGEMRTLFAGRLEEAERLLARITDRARPQGVDVTTFDYVSMLQRWALRREQGRLAEMEEVLERFVEEYPTLFQFRCVVASMYVELGRDAEARAALDRFAANDFADLNAGTEWFCAGALLAGVSAALDGAPHAARLYRALEPYRDSNVLAHPEVSLGSAARYLGLLASTMGRFDAAARHFERALDMNARMGAPGCVAHTHEDYARMLLTRDGPGDAERAQVLRAEALATYRELGMQPYAAATRA